ncbi:plasmid mobilization relaxosome protein MobC, partial [Vibrio parahaemolyticus]
GSENAASNASVQQELLTTLFTTHRLLAGIANNVNQIARVGNSTGAVPAEAPAVLDAARRAAEQIDELVDAIAEAIR